MLASRGQLQGLLTSNVVDVRFLRRRVEAGRPATRRMLCTTSTELLHGVNGRTTLNFRPPKHGLKINPAQKNLVMAWDILMQDYRFLSMDSCDIIRQWPADEAFWKIFNEEFFLMDAGAKILFMDT